MKSVLSKDGTKIAYEVTGQGPAVVLVDGALCYHDSGPSRKIAALLSQNFTTYLYDRRGRGESGDTKPFAIEREIEDLAAIIKVAGGSAFVFGQSSGAVLSLEAARLYGPTVIQKLALYEAPMIVNDDRSPLDGEDLHHMQQLIAEDRRGDAVRFFFKSIQLPGAFSVLIRLTPIWAKLKAVAHTLPYDFAITTPYQSGCPLSKDRWNDVTMPTWVGAGGKSPLWMKNSEQALANILSIAQYHVLSDQTHNLKAEGLVPELAKFFAEPSLT